MRTIFINRFFYPDESATSQILTDLAFYLGEQQKEVLVIASDAGYVGERKMLKARDQVGGIDIRRIRSLPFRHNSLLGRVCNFSIFYIGVVFHLLAIAGRNDLVICKTDPPLGLIPAYIAARAKSARFANWVQDVFPETALALGLTWGLRPFLECARVLRDTVWRKSDFNVVIGELMKDFLLCKGCEPEKIKVIPNWADDTMITPISKTQSNSRSVWGLDPQKLVFAYSGNLGRAHDVATVTAAMRALEPEKKEDIPLLIVGGGALLGSIAAQAQRGELTNVLLQEHQPREQLSDSLAAGDVHWISLNPALEGYVVPSKFYGICAAGRPIIFVGSADGEIARLIRRFDCGFVIPPGNGRKLADLLTSLSDDPRKIEKLGSNARALIDNGNSRQTRLDEWLALLEETEDRIPGEIAEA